MVELFTVDIIELVKTILGSNYKNKSNKILCSLKILEFSRNFEANRFLYLLSAYLWLKTITM